MTDSSPDTDDKLDALFRASTPNERVRMATSMFGFAKRLTVAGIRQSAPELDEKGVQAALLERLHGDVLGAIDRGRVMMAITDATARASGGY